MRPRHFAKAAKEEAIMATKQTSLFLPEEHRIISNWLDVKPKEKISDDLTLDDALKNLNLDPEELNIHSTEEYAV